MSSLSTVAANDCSLFREYVQADAFRETDLKHVLGWLSLLQPAEIFRTQDWELWTFLNVQSFPFADQERHNAAPRPLGCCLGPGHSCCVSYRKFTAFPKPGKVFGCSPHSHPGQWQERLFGTVRTSSQRNRPCATPVPHANYTAWETSKQTASCVNNFRGNTRGKRSICERKNDSCPFRCSRPGLPDRPTWKEDAVVPPHCATQTCVSAKNGDCITNKHKNNLLHCLLRRV